MRRRRRGRGRRRRRHLFNDLVKERVSRGVSVAGRQGGEEVWRLARQETQLVVITGDLIRQDLLPERDERLC